MATTELTQNYANQQFATFLQNAETKLINQVTAFGSRSEPPTQAEMLSFQLSLQAFTFMGQFASTVQKELNDAVKSVVSRM